jgi:hypothetical protein
MSFAIQAQVRKCEHGHVYHTDQIEARWRTKGGQARYWCPRCRALGTMPPRSWYPILVSAGPKLARSRAERDAP